MNFSILLKSLLPLLLIVVAGWSQEIGTTSQETTQDAAQTQTDGDLKDTLADTAKEVENRLNQSETVQEASAGILKPIYQLSEYLTFSSFYWVAFTLMVAGVVSYALQLVLGKFFLLFKLSLNIKEILSDTLGLLISLIGLVLTTQAATQNSSFSNNAAAVVSATLVGVLVGLVFYWWGQSLEHQAARRIKEEPEDRRHKM